jgi:hypothetical protein
MDAILRTEFRRKCRLALAWLESCDGTIDPIHLRAHVEVLTDAATAIQQDEPLKVTDTPIGLYLFIRPPQGATSDILLWQIKGIREFPTHLHAEARSEAISALRGWLIATEQNPFEQSAENIVATLVNTLLRHTHRLSFLPQDYDGNDFVAYDGPFSSVKFKEWNRIGIGQYCAAAKFQAAELKSAVMRAIAEYGQLAAGEPLVHAVWIAYFDFHNAVAKAPMSLPERVVHFSQNVQQLQANCARLHAFWSALAPLPRIEESASYLGEGRIEINERIEIVPEGQKRAFIEALLNRGGRSTSSELVSDGIYNPSKLAGELLEWRDRFLATVLFTPSGKRGAGFTLKLIDRRKESNRDASGR